MRILTFLALVAIWGCQTTTSEPPQTQAIEAVYFDLEGYFQEEIERLEQAEKSATKIVRVNDQTEEKTLQQLDFSQELDVFINADINRPDWIDKYKVDSTFQNGALTQLLYEALTEQLRVRHIQIDFQEGKVSKIVIKKGGNSNIAGSEQEIMYLPKEGYNIQSTQYTAISKEEKLGVEVRFRD